MKQRLQQERDLQGGLFLQLQRAIISGGSGGGKRIGTCVILKNRTE
jgi:hypothetical protein